MGKALAPASISFRVGLHLEMQLQDRRKSLHLYNSRWRSVNEAILWIQGPKLPENFRITYDSVEENPENFQALEAQVQPFGLNPLGEVLGEYVKICRVFMEVNSEDMILSVRNSSFRRRILMSLPSKARSLEDAD